MHFIIEKGVWYKCFFDWMLNRPGVVEYPDDASEIVVPEGVTKISSYAFDRCDKLTGIVLPHSLEKIGDRAFRDCSKLKHLTIPDGVTDIGEWPFSGCDELKELTLPAGLRSISGENSWESPIPLHAPELSLLPMKLRPLAALGLALEKDLDPVQARVQAHFKYIGQQAPKPDFMALAFDRPELLGLMCREKLLPAKCYDDYAAEAARRGDPELTALLLDYQQNGLGSETVQRIRRRQAAKREKDADAVAERAVSRGERTIHDGIAGLVFAITGKLKGFKGRDEFKAFLESYGASLAPSVSAKVDYLVTNDAASGSEKNEKAQALGVEVIDEATFDRLTCRRFEDAEEITVPGWVTSIADNAFDSCPSLKRVMLPEGLIAIGGYAFSNCRNLESLHLPSSVKEINPTAFPRNGSWNSCALRVITVDKSSRSFRSVDGVLFSKKGSRLICFPSARREIEYQVPEGVSVIGDRAFMGCHCPERVTLPESLTEIKAKAFAYCSNLRTLELPQGVKAVRDEAFDGCGALEEFRLKGDIERFSERAFGWSPALKLKVLEVKHWNPALNDVTKEWSISRIETEYPDSIPLKYRSAVAQTAEAPSEEWPLPETLEGLVFSVMGKLETFVDRDDISETLEKYGAKLAPGLSKKVDYLVTNAAALSPEKALKAQNLGIRVIDEGRFNEILRRSFRDQEEIVVPAWVRSIESKAFKGCASLVKVRLPEGLEEIDRAAFQGCVRLKEINLPKGLTYIGDCAFDGCSELRDIRLPEGLTALRAYAFRGCEKLEALELPASMGPIISGLEANAFPVQLRTIRVAEGSPYYTVVDGVLYSKDGTKLFYRPAGLDGEFFRVPEGITDIEWHALTGNTLREVELPEGLERIAGDAFENCSQLVSITLPRSVRQVEIFAFWCPSLRSISLRGDIPELHEYAFTACKNVESISVVHWNENLNLAAKDWPLKRIEAKYPESVPEAYRELVVKGEAGR